MSETIDPRRCPLCGELNACGMAEGGVVEECWCKSAELPAEILEQVPAAARNVACVCAECALGRPRGRKLALAKAVET